MAQRYFVNGGVDSNWGTIGNWSTTSGGAGGSAVPTSSDDVHFDDNSPSCVVNTQNRVALTLDFTGYANIITMTFQITVSGNVTLSSAMSITGTGSLIVAAAATITSNGKVWPNAFLCGSAVTLTLADAWTVGSSTFSINSALTVNGFSLSITGSLSFSGITTASLTGTTQWRLIGTGTLTLPAAGTGGVRSELVIDTAGTITLAAAVGVFGGTFTYIAGTVVTTGSTLQLTTNSGTVLNTYGIVWNNVSFGATQTHTLTSNLSLNGVLTLGISAATNTVINGFSILMSGSSVASLLTTGNVTGTTVLKITGTCSLGSTSMTTGRVAIPLVIDAAGFTVTFSYTWNINISTTSYIAGTVVAANTWPSGSGPYKPMQSPIFGGGMLS